MIEIKDVKEVNPGTINTVRVVTLSDTTAKSVDLKTDIWLADMFDKDPNFEIVNMFGYTDNNNNHVRCISYRTSVSSDLLNCWKLSIAT